jgi:hypothetical protein
LTSDGSYTSIVKLALTLISIINFCRFKNRTRGAETGWVQKWIGNYLYGGLIFCQTVAVIFHFSFSIAVDRIFIISDIFDSTFLLTLLYFWLLLLHTIASLNNDISISHRNFFYPKRIVCAVIYLHVLVSKLLTLYGVRDVPFERLGDVLLVLYLIYTLCIIFKVLSVIKYLNNSYRYSTWCTICCCFATVGLLLSNA